MSVSRPFLKLRAYKKLNAKLEAYSNNGLPETVSNIGNTLDYIVASVFPNARPAVATENDLPTVGNEINDYRIVNDYNNTGQAAGYRWSQQEGQASPQWNLVQLFDSQDSILQQWETNAAGIFVSQLGVEDIQGQLIHGSTLANGNLTLSPNSGDGSNDPALQTGYIGLFGNTKPTHDNVFNLGSQTERFASIYLAGNLDDGTDQATVAQMAIAYAHSQIVSGNPHQVNYEELVTRIGSLDLSGDITSVSVDLSTSGNKTVNIEITDDSHNHTTATITDFDDASWALLKTRLVDTDTVTWTFDDINKHAVADVLVNTSEIEDIDSPQANKIMTSNPAGDNWRASDGRVSIIGDVEGDGVYDSTTDEVEVNTSVNNVDIRVIDRITLDNLTFSSTAGNPTNINLAAHGLISGRKIRVLGTSFDGEYVITRVDDNNFTIPTTTSGAEVGYILPDGSQLLYDSLSDTYLVRLENAQLAHFEIALLNADDHKQYNHVNGRTDSTLNKVTGGSIDNAHVYIRSNPTANRGDIILEDRARPENDSVYSGGTWEGNDLGTETSRFRDLYIRGELRGGRLEEVTSLPIATVQEKGRLVRLPNGDVYQNKDGISYILLADNTHKDIANGFCSLDANTKIPIANIPDSLIGGVNYQGSWDANSNTPDLTLVNTKGYYYVVSVDGTTDLDGITDWKVGDIAIHNGTIFEKIDNTDKVQDVNGQSGSVTLTKADIGLATVLDKEQLTKEAGSFNALVEKVNPVLADYVIIEDSEDSFNKKKVNLTKLLVQDKNSVIPLQDVDWSTSDIYFKDVIADETFTFSNAVDGQTIIVIINNTDIAPHTMTWPAGVKVGPAYTGVVEAATETVFTFLKSSSKIYLTEVKEMI